MMPGAYEFRNALQNNLDEAAQILKKNPQLIHAPVYGKTETALHFFAVENQLETVSWLLSKGAKPDGLDSDETPLIVTSQLGHTDICKTLLDAGANPNFIDELDETPLFKACAGGHLEVIKLLLSAGADPNYTNDLNETPQSHALPRKHEEICSLLSKHGR